MYLIYLWFIGLKYTSSKFQHGLSSLTILKTRFKKCDIQCSLILSLGTTHIQVVKIETLIFVSELVNVDFFCLISIQNSKDEDKFRCPCYQV